MLFSNLVRMNKATKIFKVQTSGRVNLIGEHTDHQRGFVLPIAINNKITLYGSLRNDKKVLVYSDSYKEDFLISLSEIDTYVPNKGNWHNFVIGVLKSFNENISLSQGCYVSIFSDLPHGSGLSSSASLEIGLFTLFEQIYGKQFDPIVVVKTCWEVENNFIGVKCGIMDQFVVRFGQPNCVLKINCNDLTYESANLPSNISILVLDTNIRHKLIDSPYNTRIQECTIALQKIKELGFNITNLSELSINDLQEIKKNLQDLYFRRTKHVVTENTRVKDFFDILKHGNDQYTQKNLGKLLYDSHESLRNDFEASWDRADMIVHYCRKFFASEIFGARMLGGGWGGSVLLLVDKKHKYQIGVSLKDWFFKTFDEEASIFEFTADSGTKFEEISENKLPEESRRQIQL